MICLIPSKYWADGDNYSKCFLYSFSIKSKTRLVFPQPVGPVKSVVCGSLIQPVILFIWCWYRSGPEMYTAFPAWYDTALVEISSTNSKDFWSNSYACFTCFNRASLTFLNPKISHTSLPQNYSSSLRVSCLFCPWNLTEWKAFENYPKRGTQCPTPLG